MVIHFYLRDLPYLWKGAGCKSALTVCFNGVDQRCSTIVAIHTTIRMVDIDIVAKLEEELNISDIAFSAFEQKLFVWICNARTIEILVLW